MHGCVASTTNLWDAVGIIGCFAVVFTFLGWMLSRSRGAALEEQATSTKPSDDQ
jgi:putative Mn2+ efflux pump MntP